jgi:hypothetical protein
MFVCKSEGLRRNEKVYTLDVFHLMLVDYSVDTVDVALF